VLRQSVLEPLSEPLLWPVLVLVLLLELAQLPLLWLVP
jgi:hypothetical protein